MTCKVGDKGEIVIEKELREQLGIRPGWIAMQRLVDNRIEIQFIPPEHDKSLKGSLAEYVKKSIAPGEEWDEAREAAWNHRAQKKMGISHKRHERGTTGDSQFKTQKGDAPVLGQRYKMGIK